MREFLYMAVGLITKIHNKIMQLNNAYETNFTDKDLHFLVIGFLGLAMILVVYPLFKHLAKTNHVMVIAWIYVFTLIIVITFAIEIGQKISHTGSMDFGDIMYGVVGFLVMFFIFSVLRMIYHGVLWVIRQWKGSDLQEEAPKPTEAGVDQWSDLLFEVGKEDETN